MYISQGMIRVGDEFWQYYGGSPLTHHEVALPFLIKHEYLTFSRVVSRLDGYVSAEADVKGLPGGSVRVGLLDKNDNVIEGRYVNDCIPIEGDHIDKLVEWKTGYDVKD